MTLLQICSQTQVSLIMTACLHPTQPMDTLAASVIFIPQLPLVADLYSGRSRIFIKLN